MASFSELGFACFGTASIYIINFVVAVATVGMPIAYFMIFGDIVGPILIDIGISETSFFSSEAFAKMVLAVLLYFFVIQKRIQEMKIAGVGLFAGVIMFLIILAAKLISGKQKADNIQDFNIWSVSVANFGMWSRLMNIILAYAFQSSFYPAYNSLRVKNHRNGIYMTTVSIVFVFFVYVSIALVTIFAFGDEIDDNILANISDNEGDASNDWMDYILMVMFIIITAMHIPIGFFVGKESVIIIIDEIMRGTISNAQ